MNIQLKHFICGTCSQFAHFAVRNKPFRWQRFPARVTCVIFGKEKWLIDSGYAGNSQSHDISWQRKIYNILVPNRQTDEQNISFQLKRESIRPQEISNIFISHFHADHIGGLSQFIKSKYICSAYEYKRLMKMSVCSKLLHGFFPELLPADFEKRSLWIEDFPRGKDIFGLPSYCLDEKRGIFAVFLPGHTLNQYGLFLEQEKVLFAADAAWSPLLYEQGILPSKIGLLVQENQKDYLATGEVLKEMWEQGITIYLTHGN